MTALLHRLRFFVCFACLVSLGPAQAAEESESDRLNAFFEQVHEAGVARWPEWQTSLGLKTNYDQWNDRSEERGLAEHEITIRNLTALRHDFDYEKLDEAAKISYRLFERGAELGIAWFPYRHHGYAVTHLGGVHLRIPSFLSNRHRIDDRGDAEAYLARLRGVPKMMAQIIQRMETRADKGIIAPRFVFPQVLGDIDRVMTGAPFDNSGEDTAILADFREKVVALELPAPETAALIQQAEAALTTAVAPAYGALRRTMVALQARASDDDGAWKFPDGAAYYALALRSTTTTSLSPAEIHDFGLAEVARIHAEMRGIVETIGFDGDLAAFFDFIRHDPANFFPNTEDGRAAYLAESRAFIAEMKASLDQVFSVQPQAELVVKRVEPYREKTTNIGFYNAPAAYGDRPGMYYVNLYDMTLMPKSHMESLAYHEAVPGHHMQIAIAQELEGLPKFRKFAGYTAYTEGWALYAERLSKEMGFFREPLSDFGRLAWELLRAARLVVDTGLHFKRWTRKEAIAYMDANLPVTHEVNRKAIERYIVWPSQATAYKIGMHKILELRGRAKTRLGAAFDLRDFHRVVLGNGALPLDVLEEIVERWIAAGGG